MDETAAGLNETERGLFKNIRSMLNAEASTIWLVEHDIELVMDLCDEIVVVNFCRVIADGSPPHVRGHPDVIEAYLGS